MPTQVDNKARSYAWGVCSGSWALVSCSWAQCSKVGDAKYTTKCQLEWSSKDLEAEEEQFLLLECAQELLERGNAKLELGENYAKALQVRWEQGCGARRRDDVYYRAMLWPRGTHIMQPLSMWSLLCLLSLPFSLSLFSFLFLFFYLFFLFFLARQNQHHPWYEMNLLQGANRSPPHLDFCALRHQKPSV